MSVDLVKKFVIDVSYEIDNIPIGCSGIIFKPENNTAIAYVLTAKHLFFPEALYSDIDAFKKSTIRKIQLIKDNLKLTRHSKEKETLIIKKYGNCVYFPSNAEADIAIIPVIIANHNRLYPLKIFDFESYDYQKTSFFIAGYLHETKESNLPIKLKSYEVQHLSFGEEESKNKDSGIAKLRSKAGVIEFGNISTVRTLLQGISGSGVFICDRQGTVSLGYIVSGIDDINTFLCSRIDIFIDDINLSIEGIDSEDHFSSLKTNTELFLEDEELNFEEFSDLEFLVERIKLGANAASKLCGQPLIDYSESFSKDVKELHKKYEQLKKETNALSYLYAYYAILAHRNQKKHFSAILFKRAIELNPEHKQAFIHRKAEKDDNAEKMQLASETAKEIKEACLKKIESTNNYNFKREAIKSAIFQINTKKGNYLDKEESINELLEHLKNSYEEDCTLKDPHKYFDLGQYCYSIVNNIEDSESRVSINYDNAFRYLTLSSLLLDASYPIEDDVFLQDSINALLTDINDKIQDQSLIRQQAKEQFDKILETKQSKTAKETLKEIKEILSSVNHHTLQLKQSNLDEKLLISTIKNRTAKIHENIISQTEQNNLHHLDINQANKNINLIAETSEKLKEQIEKIPDKYQIILDTDTKKEIMDTIESQLSEPISELSNIKNISEKIQDYVTNAEIHLNTILHEEKLSLEEKNTQLSSIIKKLEESQISVDEIKLHIINHLNSSEKRMLARLSQIDINDRTQYRATQVIQESISQLQRNVKSIRTEPPLKSRHEKNHSVTSEIKEIIMTCQNLESRILAKLDDTPAYHADIDFIKRSQTRFEHALLPKVVDALDTRQNHRTNPFNNYEQNSIIQPSFSSRRKTLLIACLIILFLSISYIFLKLSNYSFLDLLTSLWHTAWLKFNG